MMIAEYIDKAAFVGERLTSSEQQLRFREMTGMEAYHEFLRMVNAIPAADVTPVRHDLRAAVEVLGTYYERGLNSNYVRDPIAWALYQTWRKMDGGADNG